MSNPFVPQVSTKPNLRKCVSCRQDFERQVLVRVLLQAVTKQQIVVMPNEGLDPKMFGRSAYVCYQAGCLGIALKGRKLHKALKCSLEDDIVLVLQSCLNQLEP